MSIEDRTHMIPLRTEVREEELNHGERPQSDFSPGDFVKEKNRSAKRPRSERSEVTEVKPIRPDLGPSD